MHKHGMREILVECSSLCMLNSGARMIPRPPEDKYWSIDSATDSLSVAL